MVGDALQSNPRKTLAWSSALVAIYSRLDNYLQGLWPAVAVLAPATFPSTWIWFGAPGEVWSLQEENLFEKIRSVYRR